MLFNWLIIILGILILYTLFDFAVLEGGDFNKFGEKWVKRTVWFWLPIYGLHRLIKEVILKKK
jgi:hypothetical protein